MTDKIDFTTKFPDLYTAQHRIATVVPVPSLTFLTTQGVGHHTTSDTLEAAMQTLYGIAFSLKVYLKRKEAEGFTDYLMPPLEALRTNTQAPKEKRERQLLLVQPGTVTEKDATHVFEVARMKHQDRMLPTVKHMAFKESACIQTLHIGSYDAEQETLAFLHDEAKKAGYKLSGPHHEIYLNDKRRTASDKLQTIIRYQVKPL